MQQNNNALILTAPTPLILSSGPPSSIGGGSSNNPNTTLSGTITPIPSGGFVNPVQIAIPVVIAPSPSLAALQVPIGNLTLTGDPLSGAVGVITDVDTGITLAVVSSVIITPNSGVITSAKVEWEVEPDLEPLNNTNISNVWIFISTLVLAGAIVLSNVYWTTSNNKLIETFLVVPKNIRSKNNTSIRLF